MKAKPPPAEPTPADLAQSLVDVHECLDGARGEIRALDQKFSDLNEVRRHEFLTLTGQMRAMGDELTSSTAARDEASELMRGRVEAVAKRVEAVAKRIGVSEGAEDRHRSVISLTRGEAMRWLVSLATAWGGILLAIRGLESAWPSIIAALQAFVHAV